MDEFLVNNSFIQEDIEQLRDSLNADLYEITLKIMNKIIKPNEKFKSLSDIRFISCKNFEKLERISTIINRYEHRLLKNKFQIKKDNKFETELRKILKILGYKMKVYKSSNSFTIMRD